MISEKCNIQTLTHRSKDCEYNPKKEKYFRVNRNNRLGILYLIANPGHRSLVFRSESVPNQLFPMF